MTGTGLSEAQIEERRTEARRRVQQQHTDKVNLQHIEKLNLPHVFSQSCLQCEVCMVPTLTGKPGNVRKLFQSGKSQGILNRLEKSGNCTKNTGKMREFYPKYWKNEEILGSFYFYFFSDFLIEVYLLNRFLYVLNPLNKTPKKYWKMVREYWKSQSENVGTMGLYSSNANRPTGTTSIVFDSRGWFCNFCEKFERLEI